MSRTIFASVLVLIIVLILLLQKQEHLSNNKYLDSIKTGNQDDKNWIRLFETYKFQPNPPDARWWEYIPFADPEDASGAIRKELRMFLKSYDIKVDRGKVEIWALYPDDVVASTTATSVSGYSDDYTDSMPLMLPTDPKIPVGYDQQGEIQYLYPPGWQHTYSTNSYKANESKYRHIATVNSGEHVRGMVEFACKRVIVLARFY